MPPFDPKTVHYPYPEQTDQHYLHVKKNDGTVFDKDYPYIDENRKFRFIRFWVRLLIRLVVFPVSFFVYGLRVKGRKNLKKHKALLDHGVISVSNHVHLWDYLFLMQGIRPRWPRVIVWAPNIRGENGKLMRLVGGVPIPEGDMSATMVCFAALEKYVKEGGWLQVYPEGSMWEYYAPIRPLKKGVAYFADRFDRPIVPFAYSYRKPNWFRRKVFKQIALFTLNIGEPLFINRTLPPEDQQADLTKRVHEAMCRLAGIDPTENRYPPIFNKDKRVDYYATEYGIGYKG